ncbi:MAG: hypothetical protein HQK54_16580 [Oligoflexales bacterium]|nr:hypothetical protein [Oligoflexales bacterium]
MGSNGKSCKCHGNAVYGIGMIGAMVYYIGNAPSFWQGVLGFCKALVWPGFVVYKLMESLKL